VFGLVGLAPFVNLYLYKSKMTFVYWLMALFWENIVGYFTISLFFWGLAIGLLIFWAIRLWRKGTPGERTTSKSTPTGNAWILPLIGLLLGTAAAGIVLYCLFQALLFASIFRSSSYKDSISYQGHVYHLAIKEMQSRWGEGETVIVTFAFETSQCDASGWFCRVVDDSTRDISLDNDLPIFSAVDDVDAHLQINPSQRQLLIFYECKTTSDTGKIIYSIP
jgi:hypothetical protein